MVANRPSAAARGYGAKWQAESQAFLAIPQNHWCAYCKRRASAYPPPRSTTLLLTAATRICSGDARTGSPYAPHAARRNPEEKAPSIARAPVTAKGCDASGCRPTQRTRGIGPHEPFEFALKERLLDQHILVLTELLARAVAESIDRPGDEDMLARSDLADDVIEAIEIAISKACREYLQKPELQMHVQGWWRLGPSASLE